jgi:hypothetical protein
MWLNMSRATLTEHTGQICMIEENKVRLHTIEFQPLTPAYERNILTRVE